MQRAVSRGQLVVVFVAPVAADLGALLEAVEVDPARLQHLRRRDPRAPRPDDASLHPRATYLDLAAGRPEHGAASPRIVHGTISTLRRHKVAFGPFWSTRPGIAGMYGRPGRAHPEVRSLGGSRDQSLMTLRHGPLTFEARAEPGVSRPRALGSRPGIRHPDRGRGADGSVSVSAVRRDRGRTSPLL